MNEELLHLNESTLQEYTAQLIGRYEERQHELQVLVSNMPQKHSFANYIFSEVEKVKPPSEVQQAEVAILTKSAANYLLFTNTVLYLERRWNTQVILGILSQSLSEEQYRTLLPLVIDEKDGVVDNACAVEPFALELPDDFSEIERLAGTLGQLHQAGVVSSVRDTFTAYKVILVYSIHTNIAIQELLNLIKLEQVNFKDAIGAILLGIIESQENLIYYAELLAKLCRKQKSIGASLVQLFITLFNHKFGRWESIQQVIPHLYLGLEKDRMAFSSLLHTLNLASAVLLFELADGKVPQLKVFERCRAGRASLPAQEVRNQVQALLNIPAEETYLAEAPCPVPEPTQSFPSPVSYQEIGDIQQFFVFFVAKAAPSFTHFNNHLLEYRDVFLHTTPEERAVFVQLILSSRNSLVYKELAVHRVYQLVKDRC